MSETLYLFENEKLKLILSNELPEALPLKSAILKERLNGVDSLEFTVPADHPDAQLIKPGNTIFVRDFEVPGSYRGFYISEESGEHEDSIDLPFYCESLAVRELNDEIVKDVRPQDTTALDALERILADANSRWQVGIVDDFGINSITVYYTTAAEGVKKVAETWGGELRFRITMNSKNEITGRYIDLVQQRGRVTMKRFEYSKDLTSVTRHIDMKPVKTALYGRGKGEQTDSEGYGRRITFADVEWKVANGDPVDKPKGQEWVGDPEALQMYGFVNPDGSRSHRFGIYVNEEQTDPEKLLQETWNHLQSIKDPKYSYSMNVCDLFRMDPDEYSHEAVFLGDTVAAIDRDFGLEAPTRVSELDRDLLIPANSRVTIGDVLLDFSSLVQELQRKIDQKISFGAPIGWLEGIIDAARSEFHSRNGYVYITDKDGLLVTNRPMDNIDNPPDQAIQLKAGMLAIADKRLPDGTFDFRTFITGDQVIADRINTGRIRTDTVEIGDDDGRVLINGDGVTIKGGALKVYSTFDASDNGVMIQGNKITTNFIRNPSFEQTPGSEWTLYSVPGHGTARYSSSKKAIVVDTQSTMTQFVGVSQDFDVYHSKATFRALFKCNLTGSSNPKKVRFYLYNWDKNGNRLADLYFEEQLALFQKWHLLDWNVTFPAGTVKSRLFVQVYLPYTMSEAFELHEVWGSYDDYVTQDQLVGIPMDVYNYDGNPQVQVFNISVTLSTSTAAGTTKAIGRVNWDKAFTPLGPNGQVKVILQPWGSNSTLYSARPYAPDEAGFTLYIYTHASLPASTINIFGLAYRADYLGNYGFAI